MRAVLHSWIIRPRPWWSCVLWGLACAVAGVVVRLLLSPLLGATTPFIAFFPAVLAAGVVGGAPGGLACLLACSLGGALFFMAAHGGPTPGARAWVALVIFLLSGGMVCWIADLLRRTLMDMDAVRRRDHLLVQELQHRVKNTLAIVQALAAQTLQADAPPATLRRDFTDRLIALADAHNLLSEAAWDEVGLRELARRALAPFVRDQPERVRLDGPEVSLPPDRVVSLALCLHELATNATKYGALASPAGAITIRWEICAVGPPRRISICWIERGGPEVEPPVRAGFGSRLLRRGLSPRTRPDVEIVFAPEGLTWRATFDVDEDR